MNLNDANNKCENGSNLLDPKSDKEVNFFKKIFANEDFWVSSDTESVSTKNVVCQLNVSGKL